MKRLASASSFFFSFSFLGLLGAFGFLSFLKGAMSLARRPGLLGLFSASALGKKRMSEIEQGSEKKTHARA